MPPKQLVIAFVSPGWPPETVHNGIVAYTANLRVGLEVLGVRSFVLALGSNPPGPDDGIVPLEVPPAEQASLRRFCRKALRRLAPRTWRARAVATAILAAVARLRETTGLDLLEMEESFGIARYVAPRCPVPVVVRLHGPWFLVGGAQGLPRDRAFRHRVRAEGLGIRRAAGVSAPSRSVLESVRTTYDLPLHEAMVIPGSVAARDRAQGWRFENCEPNRILFVGRFDRVKGADLAIRSAALLLDAHPQLVLTVVGPDDGLVDGDGRCWHVNEFVERILPGNAGRRHIEYLGPQPASRVAELRRQALVTIVPSRYETFANTALEAMAAGCPLVAAAVGGLAELVHDGQNGLFCRADDPVDLADRIRSLLDDPAQAARLGQRAAQDVNSRLCADVLAAQTVKFYRGVIERWPGPRCRSARRVTVS